MLKKSKYLNFEGIMNLQESENVFEKAKNALDNGDTDEAIELFLKIDNTSPELKEINILSQYYLGHTFQKKGEIDDAILYWERIPNDAKETYAEVQTNIGALFVKQEKYEKAENAYKNVLRKDSKEKFAESRLNLGLMYKDLNRSFEAITVIKTIKRTDSALIYAWAQLFLYYFADNNLYLKKIRIEDSAKLYSKAQFELGRCTTNLRMKHNYWKNIPTTSDIYSRERYQIETVKYIAELEGNRFKNEFYKVFEKVSDILRSLFIDNKFEQYIAHYTDLTVSKLLLSSKDNEKGEFEPLSHLRLNTINLMNDPEEGLLINKLLCFNYKTATQDSAFIACFTLHHDSLNQFRLYAKEGEQEASGLSLVLDKNFFSREHNAARIYEKNSSVDKIDIKTEENTLAAMPLYRCIYFDPTSGLIKVAQREKWSFWREFKLDKEHHWYDENEEAENNWKEYIHGVKDENGQKKIKGIVDIEEKVVKGLKELSQLITAVNLEELNQKQQELLAEIILPLRYLMKHMAFKEEQECRIVYVTKMENLLVKYHKEINRIYIDYGPYVIEHLEKIYLAPKAKDERTFMEYLCAHGQTVRQHKVTKESNGRVQVKISQNPFR